MKIKQLYCVLDMFAAPIKRKYGLKTYTSYHKPVFSFGGYNHQILELKKHKGFALIAWVGSDSMGLHTKTEHLKFFNDNKDRIKHVAISNFISDDLKKAGIPHKLIPITPFDHKDITPHPPGDKIYLYAGHPKIKIYKRELGFEIAREIGIDVVMCFSDSYNREQLLDVYKKSFIGLRLTEHDGLPNTVIELGLMGRLCIYNGYTPNSIPWTDKEDIIKTILYEYENRDTVDVNKISESVREYITVPDFLNTCLYTDMYDPIDYENMQTVSVVMNTYKEKKEWLIAAIESYLDQEGVDVELIVSMVEGDPNLKHIENYPVKVVISKEPGIYNQLNNALEEITGQWYCYASSNDIALPGKLLQEVNHCVDNNKKVCYSAFEKCDENLNVVSRFKPVTYRYNYHIRNNIVSDCSLVRADILKKYMPFDTRFGNSAYHDFWLRVYEGEGNVFYKNMNPTWKYRITTNSRHIRKRNNITMLKQDQANRKKMIECHQNLKLT